MPKIVVQVMPKQELLDPQGKAVAGALHRLGKGHFDDVRVGKRFEISTDREISQELMEEVAQIADDLLANGVIEDVISIDVLPEDAEDLVDLGDEQDADDETTIPLDASTDAQAHLDEQAQAPQAAAEHGAQA
ncbi:Phosphoribosylformylglycinamidine synthase subunit PurS [Pseudoclavibacter triregionum]|nr:Phosphoribosylformylglycinamidine synthase subunit PurS [Pseudoclavibacter triregionum]